ncbi:MAG: glycosyltransferase family 39 protein [Deltaproteobacteria bacterium]|nr:glycosyltransferase family 39 protein [Deltaproteobacteria bacterium]
MSRQPHAEMLREPAATADAPPGWARALLQWGVPLLTWLAALALTWRGRRAGATLQPPQAPITFYVPALGFLLLGCLPSLFAARAHRHRPHWLSRTTLLALTAAVLTVAVGLRLWRVADWPPPGIGFEEFQLGGRAEGLGSPYESLLAIYNLPGEHALTAWATALSFATFDQGFVQLRLPYILAGLVAPFLLLAVCRRLVAWESALFAVALFAVAWWPIAASRAADEIFFPMWVELLLLWALIELEDNGRAWAGFLLALSSGLLVYEYTSYHLALPLLIAYLVARLAAFGVRTARRTDPGARRDALARAWRTYGAAAVTMLLVWFILANLQLLRGGRAAHLFAGGAAQHAEDAGTLLTALATPRQLPAFVAGKLSVPLQAALLPGYGEQCRYLGTGAMPLFDPATALALGAAFPITAWTWRRRMHLLALVLAVLIITGAALLAPNANLHRYFTGLPVFFLLIALAADVVWQRAGSAAARWAVLGAFAGLAGYAAAVNAQRLERDVFTNPTYIESWRWPRTEIIRWIRAQPRTDAFCVALGDGDGDEIQGASPLSHEYRFLTRGWEISAAATLDDCPLPDPATAHPAVHVIWALPECPAGLGDRLRSRDDTVVERAPIALPARFEARVFTIPATL